MSEHTPEPWVAVGAWVEHPDDDVADICSCDPATLNRERHHIYDLLARIHRDGGQYTAEHGVEKSCDDAEAQVVTWLETISSVDAMIEQARIAEREACAKTCEREAVLYDIRGAYKTGNHCAEEIRARGKS